MHELSIARALVQLVEEHRPVGSTVATVRVQVGPMQAIVPEAMTLAWQVVTQDAALAGAELQLEMLPWRLRCLECDRQWEADSFLDTCQCGSGRSVPVGGNELLLDSLEITEVRPEEADGFTAEGSTTTIGESR